MANQDRVVENPAGASGGYKWTTRMGGWILESWFSQLAGYLASRDSLAISGGDVKGMSLVEAICSSVALENIC